MIQSAWDYLKAHGTLSNQFLLQTPARSGHVLRGAEGSTASKNWRSATQRSIGGSRPGIFRSSTQLRVVSRCPCRRFSISPSRWRLIARTAIADTCWPPRWPVSGKRRRASIFGAFGRTLSDVATSEYAHAAWPTTGPSGDGSASRWFKKPGTCSSGGEIRGGSTSPTPTVGSSF
jgi:hypothetical protein